MSNPDKDIQDARIRTHQTLIRLAKLHAHCHQENEKLSEATLDMHDRVNEQVKSLRREIPTLKGKEKRDAENAYLLACDRRYFAMRAHGTLGVLKSTIHPLQ